MERFIPFCNTNNYITIILIFTLINNLPASESSSHSKEYNICSQTFNCGNFTGLSYPFYTQDRPKYCGHPGFELLNCNQQAQHIKLMILSQTFLVLDINQTTSTITVAREDFFGGSGCPLTLTNITINFSIFNYATHTSNITLLYNNCSTKCGFAFPCPMGGGTPVPMCYFTDKMMQEKNITATICPDRLFIPVHESDYEKIDAAGGYSPVAVWNGFELKWNADNVLCQNCVSSGGQCGHDPKSNKFFCFCSDESKCPFPVFSLLIGIGI